MEERFKESDVILNDTDYEFQDYKILKMPIPYIVIRPDNKHELNITIDYIKDKKHHRRVIQVILEKE